MSGQPGNPNHDARTGRFTSRSGLNKSNSTYGQRGKALVKEHSSDAKAYVAAAVGATAAAFGVAVLQGIAKPTRIHATHITNHIQKAAIAKGGEIAAAYGPKVSKALRQGTSSLINHVRNMKKAGAIQHTSRASGTSDYRISPRPRVRHKGA